MKTEVKATYRVITPMFCAGAEPEQAEVRLPSFKGVLRFWWRALSWSRLGGDLTRIRKNEAELFGSSSGGQSRVSLRLKIEDEPEVVPKDAVLTISSKSDSPVGEGARYLGYGAMEAFSSGQRGTLAGQLVRACQRAPFDFTVLMRGRRLSKNMIDTLKDALIAVGVFGGMGARSRRGYGSLNLLSLSVNDKSEWTKPTSVEGLAKRIEALKCGKGPAGTPDFTAFSTSTRHVLVKGSRDNPAPLELLDLVGREFIRYRGWGRGGRVLGGVSERNFRYDHDLMESTARGTRPSTHPRRVAFGLPHNYGRSREQKVGPYRKGLHRRASPLFIHIHQCDNEAVAVLSFFPTQFLPPNTGISVGSTRVDQQPECVLYLPVHDYLDRLLDPNRCKEPLTAEEVG